MVRSGKIQFLFWAAFFSVMLYLWIFVLGLQTFILPDEKPMELPENAVILMFILYGLLVLSALSGLIVSTIINNKFYTRFFGAMVIIVFATIIAAKGIFG